MDKKEFSKIVKEICPFLVISYAPDNNNACWAIKVNEYNYCNIIVWRKDHARIPYGITVDNNIILAITKDGRHLWNWDEAKRVTTRKEMIPLMQKLAEDYKNIMYNSKLSKIEQDFK